ncbi:uncharacterized protein LOC144701143 isoform X1 [Wolffia australiana]
MRSSPRGSRWCWISLGCSCEAKDEFEAKKPKLPRPAVSATTAKTEAAAETTTKKAVHKDKDGFMTITMTEKFYCRARSIFEILMDENRWKGFTQSNAKISREIGGVFSLFDGSIKGVNADLKEEKSILQKWRFASWPDGVHSTLLEVPSITTSQGHSLVTVKVGRSNPPEVRRRKWSLPGAAEKPLAVVSDAVHRRPWKAEREIGFTMD